MSGLEYEVLLDDQFIVANPKGVVEIGSNNVLQNHFPANSVSNSQLQWNNILSQGENSCYSNQWRVKYTVAVTADASKNQVLPGCLFTVGADITANRCVLDPAPYVPNITSTTTNAPNIFFRQLPLSSITNSISLTLNNVEGNATNLAQQIAICDPLDEDDKKLLANACPVDRAMASVVPDLYTITVTSNVSAVVPSTTYQGMVRQPNTPWWASGRNVVLPSSVDAGTNAVYTANYTIYEPVLISPLSVKPGPALMNVQSFSLKYALDSSNNLNGMLECSNQMTQASVEAVNYNGIVVNMGTTAELYIQTYQLDPIIQPVPKIIYYDYDKVQFQQTKMAVGNTATQFPSSSFKLSTVPKIYMAKVATLQNGLIIPNNLCSCSLDLLTITFGSFGQFTFDSYQLFFLYQKNAKDYKTSYNEWLANPTIILNPTLDMKSSVNAFAGITNSSGYMWSVNITTKNTNLTAGATIAKISASAEYYYQEMFVIPGSIAIGENTAVYNSSTISSAQLVAGLDKPLKSNLLVKHSQMLRGGSFFSSLGSMVRGAVSALPAAVSTANAVLQHPIVQQGLSALSGAGITGGAMSYRRRR